MTITKARQNLAVIKNIFSSSGWTFSTDHESREPFIAEQDDLQLSAETPAALGYKVYNFDLEMAKLDGAENAQARMRRALGL